MTTLILASNSPRRRQLLALLGWDFRVQPADIDETPLHGEAPEQYVLRLAQAKAEAVAQVNAPEALVLAADTTVADGDAILGKPLNAGEARRMLAQLRARSHQVYTGVALRRQSDRLALAIVAESRVPMRAYSEAEVEAYIASGDPFDKAGGYAIQHAGFHPVESLSDCYANVVGLPLCHLAALLRQAGLLSPLQAAALPSACQTTLQYDCPVFEAVLGLER